jgi:excisionase family DNA binding protein
MITPATDPGRTLPAELSYTGDGAVPESVSQRKPSMKVAKRGDTEDSTRLLTLTEAAFRLGRVHRTTVMRWVKEGKLRCVRLSRKAILFEPAELDRFVHEHRSSI